MHKTLWAACVFLLAAAGRGHAQAAPPPLTPKFTPGQSIRYGLDAEFARRRGPGADDPGTVLHQVTEFRISTVSVEADGSASVRLAFERVRVELSRSGSDPSVTSWAWEEGAESGTSAGPEVPKLAEACLALARSTVEIRVEPDGWVRRVDGLDRAFEAALDRRGRGSEQPPAPLLGAFDPGAVEHTLSALWATGPGGGEVIRPKVGDSWKVVRRAPFIGDFQAEATTTLVLERAAPDRMEIGGNVRYAIIPPRHDVDPAAPLPRITDQTGRVAVVWDPAAGRLVSRRVERTLVWSATLQLERPIEVRDYTTARMEVRLLE